MMQDIDKLPYRYWTDHKWHEVKLDHNDSTSLAHKFDKSRLVLQWIVNNVDGYKKHCRWDMDFHSIKVKFRHHNDAMIFALRWL